MEIIRRIIHRVHRFQMRNFPLQMVRRAFVSPLRLPSVSLLRRLLHISMKMLVHQPRSNAVDSHRGTRRKHPLLDLITDLSPSDGTDPRYKCRPFVVIVVMTKLALPLFVPFRNAFDQISPLLFVFFSSPFASRLHPLCEPGDDHLNEGREGGYAGEGEWE